MTSTQMMILSTFALWLVWTSLAPRYGQKTVSSTLRNMAWSFNLIPFCFGMLTTHWFAPRQSFPSDLWGWGVGLPAMLLILGFDIYWLATKRERHWIRWPFWYFLAGLPVGYLYWPQISASAPF